MPRLNEMFPSNYLKSADCEDGDLVLTVREVKQETVGQPPNSDLKWVLYFQEVDKGLVLNKTNTMSIAELHGQDTDDWEGKRVALFAIEVQGPDGLTMGIRVRKKAPKPAKPAAAKGKPATAAVASEDADDNDEAAAGGDGIPF